MIHSFWCYGEKPVRSLRKQVEIKVIEPKPQIHTFLSDNQTSFQRTNKREESYNKMSEREMIGQIGYNPFNPKNNYFENLIEHEKFIKNE
jgi:hypothetical protein